MNYFDFEFEQYNLTKEILGELILDEILIYQNEYAKKHYDQLKHLHPNGILEKLFREKQDKSTVSDLNYESCCDISAAGETFDNTNSEESTYEL